MKVIIKNLFRTKSHKRHILVVDNKFPKWHSKSGEPTHFDSKIVGTNNGRKIHEICSGLNDWLAIAHEVNSGNAELMVCYSEVFGCDLLNIPICHVDKINIQQAYFPATPEKGLKVEDRLVPISEVAINEGLTRDDLVEWYQFFTGQHVYIIHFTHFTY